MTVAKDTQKPAISEDNKKSSSSHSRQLIVATAIQLFQERGYTKTSMSEIARLSGMAQSSLYYWFSSKEAILDSILESHSIPSTVEYIAGYNASCTLRLYGLIVSDVMNKCELPFDFIELESVAHSNPEKFESLLENYRLYYQAMVSVIKEGIAKGEFVDQDAEERVVSILSINEGLQHHYHAKRRGELILELTEYKVRNYSPEFIGHMSASSILPAIAAQPLDLTAIKEESIALFTYARNEKA